MPLVNPTGVTVSAIASPSATQALVAGRAYRITLDKNVAFTATSPAAILGTIDIELATDISGNHTTSWMAGTAWRNGVAPPTVAVGQKLVISLETFDGGTTWDGSWQSGTSTADRGTTLPTVPVDGQRFTYVASDALFAEWDLRFNTATGKWRFAGGRPLIVEVLGPITRGNVAYGALAGVTLTLPAIAGTADISFGSTMVTGAAGQPGSAAISIGGAAASDNDCVTGNAGGAIFTGSVSRLLPARAFTSAQTVEMHGKGATAANITFYRNWIAVTPVEIV